MPFEVTDKFRSRAGEQVAWLTTIGKNGPVPRPVWFVFDGAAFVVFSEPDAHKVRQIRENPQVTVNFNSSADGGDVLVVHGTAEVVSGPTASSTPGYLDKYESHYAGIGYDRDRFDTTYSTALRITPTRSWGW